MNTEAYVDLMGERTLGTLLEQHAQSHGDREFLAHLTADDELVVHTYAQASALVEQARSRLARLGVHDQAVVMSLLPNSTAHYVVWFATSMNGGIHLPVDPIEGAWRIAQLIKLATPRVIVTPSWASAAVERALSSHENAAEVVVVDDLTVRSGIGQWRGIPDTGVEPLPTPVNNSEIAGLIQTSGSTGVPKLVEVTHANYVFAGESLVRCTSMTPEDRHFSATPLFHSAAQYFSTMPAMVTGGSIGVVQSFSASRYFEHAVKLGGTCGVLEAPLMRMVLTKVLQRQSAMPPDTAGMRHIAYGQNLSKSEYEEWEATFPGVRLLQMYGSTEMIGLPIGQTPWNDFPPDSMGIPQIERAVKLVDTAGNTLTTGTGEICVQGIPGRTLMRGYFRNPEATAEVLRAGWYHSGDLARRDERGFFYFVARAQHVMRRAGENVSLPEVELHMQDYPLVEDVVARAIPDPILEERLVAYVIPRKGFCSDDFVAWCLDKFGRRERPDDVVLLDEFPRTGVGKVRLSKLPSPTSPGRGPEHSFVGGGPGSGTALTDRGTALTDRESHFPCLRGLCECAKSPGPPVPVQRVGSSSESSNHSPMSERTGGKYAASGATRPPGH